MQRYRDSCSRRAIGYVLALVPLPDYPSNKVARMPVFASPYRLIYHSQATVPLSEEALANLLREARQHNQAAQLSGLLLYAQDQFLQVLEGPEEEINALYARIQSDPRHHNVRTLASGNAQQRVFPDWRMGYAVSDAATITTATGFLPLPATPGLAAHPSEELAQLLRDFALGRAQDD